MPLQINITVASGYLVYIMELDGFLRVASDVFQQVTLVSNVYIFNCKSDMLIIRTVEQMSLMSTCQNVAILVICKGIIFFFPYLVTYIIESASQILETALFLELV